MQRSWLAIDILVSTCAALKRRAPKNVDSVVTRLTLRGTHCNIALLGASKGRPFGDDWRGFILVYHNLSHDRRRSTNFPFLLQQRYAAEERERAEKVHEVGGKGARGRGRERGQGNIYSLLAFSSPSMCEEMRRLASWSDTWSVY